MVREGRAAGVALASGEEFEAKIVVSNADLRTTFQQLLDPSTLDASFTRHLRAIKYRGSAARIHLALRELPEFPALAGGDATALRGPIQIAPSLDYIQRAFDCTKYGRSSEHPYLDILIPTLSDPDLAPEGQHILSATARYAPYELREGSWDSHRTSTWRRCKRYLSARRPGY